MTARPVARSRGAGHEFAPSRRSRFPRRLPGVAFPLGLEGPPVLCSSTKGGVVQTAERDDRVGRRQLERLGAFREFAVETFFALALLGSISLNLDVAQNTIVATPTKENSLRVGRATHDATRGCRRQRSQLWDT